MNCPVRIPMEAVVIGTRVSKFVSHQSVADPCDILVQQIINVKILHEYQQNDLDVFESDRGQESW